MTFLGYSAGHPWYYKLGGPIIGPKSLSLKVKMEGRTGYMDHDIDRLDLAAEPKRTETLRKLKTQILQDLDRDIRCYRDCARALVKQRRDEDHVSDPSLSNAVEGSMARKFVHLYNGFANLAHVSRVLDRQLDLFG